MGNAARAARVKQLWESALARAAQDPDLDALVRDIAECFEAEVAAELAVRRWQRDGSSPRPAFAIGVTLQGKFAKAIELGLFTELELIELSQITVTDIVTRLIDRVSSPNRKPT